MQGARRRPWFIPRASRATPQTPLAEPTLRERTDLPSFVVVASSLGAYPTSSAPPRLKANPSRSRPRGILRQAPCLDHPVVRVGAFTPSVTVVGHVDRQRRHTFQSCRVGL